MQIKETQTKISQQKLMPYSATIVTNNHLIFLQVSIVLHFLATTAKKLEIKNTANSHILMA